jgi:hypothetical protein
MKARSRRIILVWLTASLLLPSCANPRPTTTSDTFPTPTRPTQTASPPTATEVEPSRIPTAAPSAPSPTVQPDISEAGPHVAYLRQEAGVIFAVIADIRGPGKRSSPLPKDVTGQIRYDGWARNSVNHISPNGRYFAYETGTSDPPYDLQLRIIRLEDQEEIVSIPLLRKDMDASVAELISAAGDQLDEYLSDVPQDVWPDEILFSIQAGIRTFEWSPLSPVLAFVAQIDGPSTDLYVLDPTNLSPLRLTSGLENIQRLQWSPNGRWIAHGAAYSVGMGTPIDNYIVSRDGSTLLDLPDGGLQAPGWVTSELFVVNEAANGPGSFRLSAVRMPEETYRVLWTGTFSSFAFDLPNNTLILSVHEPWDFGKEVGTYLVNTNSGSSQRVGQPLDSLTTWGRGKERFLGEGDGVFAVSLDGQLRQILDHPSRISVSPDRESVVFFPRSGGTSTVLYDARMNSSKGIFNGEVTCVDWAPDSHTLLVVAGESLLSIDVESRAATQLDTGLVNDGFSCPLKIIAE